MVKNDFFLFLRDVKQKVAKPAALCALCLIAGVFYPAELRAEEEIKELRTSAVKVTASRVEKELLEVPMSVSVITEDEIRHSSAATIGELIKDVPGVQLIESGGQGMKRISIRGEDARRTLILVDGQKIVENKSMEGAPLLIDPSLVERIEVIRGPASVLYGSEAMGGVINIITRKGGAKPFQGEAGYTFSSSNTGSHVYSSVYGALNGFTYRLSGAYGNFNDRRTPDGRAHNTKYDQTNASAFLSYDFSEHFTLGGGYDYFDSDIDAGSQQRGYQNFYVDMPTWKREKFNMFAEAKDISNILSRVRFDVFYQENHKEMYNHVDLVAIAPMMPIIDNYADNKNRQLGFSLQTDWTLGDKNLLITGYEYNRDRIQARSTADQRGTIPMMTQWKENYYQGHQDQHAIFGQMETELPAYFTVNYGVRYTWVRSKMQKATGTVTNWMGNSSADSDIAAGEDNNVSRPVFNLGLMWSGIDDLTLRATFSQGFRAPSLQEQYVLSSMGGGTVYPNANLDPEKSNNFELGARYSGDNLTADLAFFYSDADDYIFQNTINAATKTSQFMNVGSAKTHGVELALSYDLAYGFTPYTNLTWMRRKFDYGTLSTWDSGVPNFFARTGLRGLWAVNESWDMRADLYMRMATSSKLISNQNDESSYTKGWQTANLSVGADFGKEKEYSINAEVLNIFNAKYNTSGNVEIYEPGINANVSVGYKF